MATLSIEFNGGTTDGGVTVTVEDFSMPSSGNSVVRSAFSLRPRYERAKVLWSDSGTTDYGFRRVSVLGRSLPERKD